MVAVPQFPPLLRGKAVVAPADPFAAACAEAARGCDAGLICHSAGGTDFAAAIVLAPEVSLMKAMAMLPVAGLGLQNALGALAPPELAVHLGWDGGVFLNGGKAGRFRVATAPDDPDTVPDWLVIGLELAMVSASDAPGDTPDATSLAEEGCGDIDAVTLLETWARHMLVWINRWQDDGPARVHTDWQALAQGLGGGFRIAYRGTAMAGEFLGVDEDFSMLLKSDGQTTALHLTGLLE